MVRELLIAHLETTSTAVRLYRHFVNSFSSSTILEQIDFALIKLVRSKYAHDRT
jgi:hypothetical protein